MSEGPSDGGAGPPDDESTAGSREDDVAARDRKGWDLRPTRRVRTVARSLLVFLVVAGGVIGGWVGLDLLSVRSSLQAAQDSLREAQRSLADVDLDAAQGSLLEARAEMDDATRRSGRFTWSIAAVYPLVGPSVQVVGEVVEVADLATLIADTAVRDGRDLLGDGVEIEVVDGRIDLTPLVEAQALLASLPIEDLIEARDALATPRDDWLPGLVRDGRSDTLALADDAIATLVNARALTDALPSFFGEEEPQAYFVGFQTSAELRATGGLIGFWGVLAVDDGQVTFGQTEDYDPFDDAQDPVGETRTERIRTIGLARQNPPNVDPAFLARYARFAAARSFPNINVDPDLPTTATAILELFEHQTDRRLDGVILLDAPGLQGMLEATGSTLPLPPEVAEVFDLGDGLPTDRFARFVTADIYEGLGFEFSDERNDALRQIGDAAFLQIFDGRWDSQLMARAVVEATNQRHLQVYTSDETVQQALNAVGATGSLEDPHDADQFAVVANNVVGGKQDVHLGHEISVHIDLINVRRDDADRLFVRRDGGLEVTIDNPLPTEGMDTYIIGSCYRPDGGNRCFEGEPGQNRTWFSLWASPQLQLVDFDSDDGAGQRSSTFRDLRVVDHAHVTPSQQRSSFRVGFTGNAPLVRELETVVYEFRWWRQSKAIPDLLDVRITPPEGWEIGHVEVVGGGSGRGMGVHGDGEDLVAEVVDGVAQLRGTVTADTRLRVHLVDPEA